MQLTLNGLAVGCIYGLVALGFVLIYKATELVNFAQGDLLMLRSAEALRAVFGPPTLIGRLGPTRFGLVTAGLTVTTVEALLNRAALAIEAAGRSDGQPESTVRFNVSQICEEASLEEMLGRDGDDFAARTHRRAKTVMLAD